jgi:hypothetical protein
MPASSQLPTSPEAYEPLCQEQFTLRSEGGTDIELTLTEVKRRINDDVQQCFSLFFQGPGPLVPDGIHRLGHSRLGEIDLFLVPIRRLRAGFVYEAVFNLLKEPEQN